MTFVVTCSSYWRRGQLGSVCVWRCFHTKQLQSLSYEYSVLYTLHAWAMQAESASVCILEFGICN